MPGTSWGSSPLAAQIGGRAGALGLNLQGLGVEHLFTQPLNGCASKLNAQNVATRRWAQHLFQL
ncbi:hypothetical protein [Deinococcus arcticus]|uniref:Uncharacterized protein n=1 Tax=Deinococcus arcticus TaxID=2136176 RepID=A0A2T3W4I6_9DEIO|nr:hypothetical protein [Deinococcus arcticus]PTA66801.1 hypothetical protein C8263_15785 [Deinococcus arcticus]